VAQDVAVTLARGVAATALVLAVAACSADRPAPTATRPDLALVGHRGAPATASWSPWPQALHDAQHTGASPYDGPRTARLRWSRRLEGNVTPGPVVGADGTVYAASNAGVLHAIDPATGRDLWTVDEHAPYGLDLSTSPAVLPSGLLLWPGPGGHLVAVTRAGHVAWRLDLGGQVTSPAVRADGTVVVATTDGLLLGLRPTGSGPGEEWRTDLGEPSYGSPVLSTDGATAYQTVTSGVVAVEAGEVRWRWRVPREIVEVSAAVAPDGTVVVGTNDPYEYGLGPRDGSLRWRFRRGFWTYSSPGVTRDGIAYFGDHGNRVTGLDVTSGDLVFSYQGSRRDTRVGGVGIWTSVLVDAGHTTYVGTRQGLVYAVDRHAHQLWSYDAGSTVDSYPALTGDGLLVIGATDGRLLGFADE
jgi:outer membrane protein assembly factor BamB